MILATGCFQCVHVQLWSDPGIRQHMDCEVLWGTLQNHMAGAKAAVGWLVCGEAFRIHGSYLHFTAFDAMQSKGRRQKKYIIVSSSCSLNFPSWKAGSTKLKLSECHLWSAHAICSTELSVANQLQGGPSTMQLHKGHRKREYINLLAWWQLNMNMGYTFKGCRIIMLVPILFRLQGKWVCFSFTRHKAIKDLKGRRDKKETDLFLVSYSVHLLHKNWWV